MMRETATITLLSILLASGCVDNHYYGTSTTPDSVHAESQSESDSCNQLMQKINTHQKAEQFSRTDDFEGRLYHVQSINQGLDLFRQSGCWQYLGEDPKDAELYGLSYLDSLQTKYQLEEMSLSAVIQSQNQSMNIQKEATQKLIEDITNRKSIYD